MGVRFGRDRSDEGDWYTDEWRYERVWASKKPCGNIVSVRVF